MNRKQVKFAIWKGQELNGQNGRDLSQRLLNVIVDIFLVLIFVRAGHIMFRDVFGFGGISPRGIFDCIVVTGIVSGIMEFIDGLKYEKKKLIKVCVPFAGAGFIAIYFWLFNSSQRIIDGLVKFASEYIGFWNAYYNTGISFGEIQGGSLTTGVGFIFIVLIFIAVWFGKYKGKRLYFSLISIFVVAIEVTVGYAPSVKGFVTMFVGILLANVLEYDKPDFVLSIKERRVDGFRNKYIYMALVSGIIALVSVGAKGLVSSSVDEALKYSSAVKQVQKDMIEKFSVSELINSIGENIWNKNKNGEIISNMPLSFKNVPMFKMYADRMPKDKMYLKGFYGAEYVGGRWLNDGDDFEDDVKAAGFDVEQVKLNISLMGKKSIEMYYNFQTFDNAYKLKATLEYLNKDNKVAYVPYFVDVYSEINIDGGVHYTKDEELSEISYIIWQENFDYEEYDGDALFGYKDEWEVWYEEYVCQQYLTVPDGMDGLWEIAEKLKYENRLTTMEGIPGENGFRARAAKAVAQWMANNMTYTLEPPMLPKNADPVEYFATVSNEGYCMHYASAATLILRKMGVPARYVSGYFVTTDGFELEDNQYVGTVMDNTAHAWVEIYLDRIGWVPLEVTTSYYEGQNPNEAPADDEQATDESETIDDNMEGETGEETSTNVEDSTSFSDVSVNENETTNGVGYYGTNNDALRGNKFVKVIIISALAILIPLGIYMVLRHYKKKEENLVMLVNKRRNVRAINTINRNLYLRLKRKGRLIGSKHTDEAYKEALIKAYPMVSGEEWNRYMDIVKEMAFSQNDGKDEDMEYCYEIYKRVRYQKMQKKDGNKKC